MRISHLKQLRSLKKLLNNVKRILEALKLEFPTDNNFLNNVNLSNRNYLPFQNGIYSFKDKKLYSYDELPDVKFVHNINRKFPERIQEDIDEVYRKILNPIFPNDNETNEDEDDQ